MINNVELAGTINSVPELRRRADGREYCTFSLAIKTDKGTDYPNCIAYGVMARVVCQNASEGYLHIKGILRTYHRGEGAENKRTEVIVSYVYPKGVYQDV